MKPAAAAAFLGLNAGTLAVWRTTKRHPLPYYKLGKGQRARILYKKGDLDAYMKSLRIG